jgi:molybdopterin-binding protein
VKANRPVVFNRFGKICGSLCEKPCRLRFLVKEDAMKLSTRNQIKGKITEVVKGKVMAKVKIDIGGGNIITSTITVDAINDLKLRKGDQVIALVKASSVMIGK